MKKSMIFLGAMALPLLASAQAAVTETPANLEWHKNLYGLYMSANGLWMGSSAGGTHLYNIETGESYEFANSLLGIGQPVANNGWALGSIDSQRAVLHIDGQTIYPESLKLYVFTSLDGITPDATRACGFVSNNEKNGPDNLPIVCNISADGVVGEPIFLPVPEKDFFGLTPEGVLPRWISDDGKTLLGEFRDWTGRYIVPIVYFEEEDGSWSYYLPSEPLFNPNHLEFGVNPYATEPPAPEVYDYMDPVKRAAYLADYEIWAANNYIDDLYPDPTDYMTEEQIMEYNLAVEEHNAWEDDPEIQEEIKEYNKVFTEIQRTSPNFHQSEMAIQPQGQFIAASSTKLGQNLEDIPSIYRFDLQGDRDYKVYPSPYPNLIPNSITDDGTIFIATSLADGEDETVTNSYVLSPGSSEFVPFVEYIADSYPEVAEWIEINFLATAGVVSSNRDQTVFYGALQLNNFLTTNGAEDFSKSTYVFSDTVELSGIESIAAENADGIYRVYNLQGVKILETRDSAALSSLPSGIYIINGKKILK
ncbi:MAG: T9SS type A sorting domain-containing protein [Muribaculaceae bacterium]|nr:T9SS type A sorting domain-containing protein [Muribaculaceae bacterium]